MLDRSRRRRANINPTLVQCLVFAGMVSEIFPSHEPVFKHCVLIEITPLSWFVYLIAIIIYEAAKLTFYIVNKKMKQSGIKVISKTKVSW